MSSGINQKVGGGWRGMDQTSGDLRFIRNLNKMGWSRLLKIWTHTAEQLPTKQNKVPTQA
ncbi:hypothetical protein C0J52_19364 [Blattella germanica]|nr:hypothetical protein C0J52_19364 [Blattella germanica]